ncbi:MAG: ATP phosphoribosyltransferase regulatory subunit [Gammaproteobacteria bacterium]
MDFAWIHPEGIEAPSIEQTEKLESLRRKLLDLYKTWGYLQTSPPFLEFADNLRFGQDVEYNSNLFELSDPVSGKRLAIRSDTTAQIASIRYNQMSAIPNPLRLCYCLPVAQRWADSLNAPRFYSQVGIELFGAESTEADCEVMNLMIGSLHKAKLDEIAISLGHTQFFVALMDQAQIQAPIRTQIASLLQQRAWPEIRDLLENRSISSQHLHLVEQLCNAHGSMDQLAEIAKPFMHLVGVESAVNELLELAAASPDDMPKLFDLADISTRLYHKGPVFSCFTPSHNASVAAGGRYMALDQSTAVGFSSSLWLLATLSRQNEKQAPIEDAIFAPYVPAGDSKHQALTLCTQQLRRSGQTVVQQLKGQDHRPPHCTHKLEWREGAWQLTALTAQPDSSGASTT